MGSKSGLVGNTSLKSQGRGYSGPIPGGIKKDQYAHGRRGGSLANQTTHNTASRIQMPNKTASSFVGKEANISSQLPPKSVTTHVRGTTGHSVR